MTNTKAYEKLFSRFGETTFNELYSLAQVLSNITNIPLADRSCFNYETILYWYDIYLDELWPIIQEKIDVVDKDGKVL